MRTHTSWDPQRYARFGEHRGRPLADLLAQVHASNPSLVVDLGCGNGPATLAIAALWPQARVVGVDDSEEMLDAARALDGSDRVEWVQGDLRDWDPASLGAPVDVIITNSTLQWVPGHLDLIPTWVGALADDGWFALQVPGNFDAPSHALMRETAEWHDRSAELMAALGMPSVGEPSTYLRLLARLGCTVDAWETTYTHVLDPEGTMDNPVLEWVSGTGLRPVLDLLTEEAERAAFLDPYAAALLQAYPRTSVGVIFPFRRVFAAAHRSRAVDATAGGEG